MTGDDGTTGATRPFDVSGSDAGTSSTRALGADPGATSPLVADGPSSGETASAAGTPIGLTEAEAARRRAAGQGNVVVAQTGRTYGQILRDNVFNFINNILFTLGVILIILTHYLDALLTVGVVLINAGVGLFQEIRAKRTLDRIAILSRPHATIVREGVERQVDPSEIVLGDTLRAGAGDQIVVDGVMVGAGRMEVDESLLTGESDLVVKRPGDKVLSGSFCAAGGGFYEAEKVGLDSFAIRITRTAQEHRRTLTPLQHQVNVLVWILLAIVLGLEALAIVQTVTQNLPFVESIQMSMVIVALVPNALVLAIIFAYAVGAIRLSGKGALIQEVNAIESLSNVDVLCTDKTGTLTTNVISLHELEPLAVDRAELERLLAVYAASTGAGNRTTEAIGAGLRAQPLPVADEALFSSARKWSGIAFDGELAYRTLVLGAPEVVAPALRAAATTSGLDRLPGAEAASAPADGGDGDPLDTRLAEWTAAGLRVLLLAGRREAVAFGGGDAVDGADRHEGADSGPRLPGDLVPLGLVSLQDELRPRVRDTLAAFHQAGIAVKVISGDNPQTVASLATQAGLEGELVAYSGDQLATMDDEAFSHAAAEGRIFGRVRPEQKERLTTALRKRGHYVAMIGDGVNDVVALKRSDIGIAMESGSQASRAVADLVLMGDSFGVLPRTFAEGRRIRNGLQDILNIFMVRIFSRAAVIAAVTFMGGFPFTPRQSALLSYLTATVPTIGLVLWAQAGPTVKGKIYKPLARFVVPATLLLALYEIAVFALYFYPGQNSYLAAHHGATVEQAIAAAEPQAQTATTVLAILCGLLLIPFTVPPTMRWVGGARLRGDWRPTIMAAVLVVVYLVVVATPGGRHLFQLDSLGILEQILLAVIAVSWGFTVRAIWHWRLLDRLFGPPEGRPYPADEELQT